jgi:cysteine desulfurase
MSDLIYLDFQATTPVDSGVLEAMQPYFAADFANSASVQHEPGRRAAAAVDDAREQVAALIGADSREIVFCSGGTEANNLALKGLAECMERRRLVIASTEHPSMLDSGRALARLGFELIELGVDGEGQPALDELEAAVDERTLLVSIAAANNEVGTLPNLRAIGEIAHKRGALLHTDAAQAAARIDLDVDRDGIDLLSLSAHKMYGPKGVGALAIRREHQSHFVPLIDGGGHERGLRSGTINTPGVVGFGAAAELARTHGREEADRLRSLASRFHDGLSGLLGGIELNGPPPQDRLPGNLNLRIRGVDSEALIANCPALCFSAGSACSSATPTPSHVLLALGLDHEGAEQSCRFGFGGPTTVSDVDRAIEIVAAAVSRIRQGTEVKQPIGAQ